MAVRFPAYDEVVIDWPTTNGLTGVHAKRVYIDSRGGRWLAKAAKYYRSGNRTRWGNDTLCEYAALVVQKAIGAPTPAFTLTYMPWQGRRGGPIRRRRVLLTQWLEGSKALGTYWNLDKPIARRRTAVSMLQAMATDYLVGDSDRHAENFLLKRGTVYGIDHGFAFNNDVRDSTNGVSRMLGQSSIYRNWLRDDADRALRLLVPQDITDLIEKVESIGDERFLRITRQRRDNDALDRLHFFGAQMRAIFCEVVQVHASRPSREWRNWVNSPQPGVLASLSQRAVAP